MIVTPVSPALRGWADPATASAMITMVDLSARPAPPGRYLAELFGLSKAETELAIALLDGKRVEDIAAERAPKALSEPVRSNFPATLRHHPFG